MIFNTKSFELQSKEVKDSIYSILDSNSLSELHSKAACKGKIQQVQFTDGTYTLKLEADRMYPDVWPYKTQTQGAIRSKITDGTNEIETTLEHIRYIQDWYFTDYQYRMIVPNEILSEDGVKPFVAKIASNDLPVRSTKSAQISYFNEIDGGEVLLENYPQIIFEEYKN